MSTSIAAEKPEEPELKWGKKRGKGGKKKDVQFYESFTYDGMDYALYDCVYMYKQGEPEPYIGKLVKIWENSDKSRKIKVQWFFRPSEISYYLKDATVMENELFFASGDGVGLANLNPLEAIAGKCNVVCISKDSRNPQPSAEELQVADYVFYRTFDVKSCTISDQMDDTVGGLEVKYVFNRRESVRTLDVPNLNSNDKDEERNVIVSAKKLKVAGKDSLQQMNNLKLDENDNRMLEKENTNVKEVLVERGSLLGEYSSGVDVNSSKNRETAGISIEKETMLGDKNVGCKDSSEKDKFKDIKSPGSQIQVEKRVKSARKSGDLDDTQSKKAKNDCTVSLSNPKDINGVQSLTSPGNDEKLSKTSVSLPGETPRSRHAEDSVGLGKHGKLTKDLNSLPGKQSKANDFLPIEKSESAHEKDSVGTQKDKKLGQNLSACRERLSINVASPNGTTRPSPTHVLPNETPKSGSESEQAAKLVKNLNASMKRPLKASADLSNEKLNTQHDVGHENKDSPLGGRPPKKAKFDDSIKMSEDDKKNTSKMKDKTCAGEMKNPPRLEAYDNTEKSKLGKGASKESFNDKVGMPSKLGEMKNPPRLEAYDNTAKSKLGKGASKESFNDKVGKPSKSSLPTPSITTFNGDDGKAEDQIFEVTRRPIVEKSNWIKLPWEEKMKTAHDQGRLVLLQNLDPEYTSGEVEDIIWHAFKEDCTAKMAQHTAISNPHSGKAFVIFKSREAVYGVVKKLDDGCLMLPNQRPLVVRTGDFLKFLEKQTTFVGHLAIDKARRQIQREMKEAVSTSHYSQNNTIEYEMAMAWCLLQSKSDNWWKKLYEQQRKELNKLRNDLKSK